MKTFSSKSFLIFLVFYLINSSLIANINQEPIKNNFVLYESDKQNIKRKVYIENNRIYFLINNLIINTLPVLNEKFRLIHNGDETSFAFIKFQFRGKADKSKFEFIVFDKFFAITFNKSFSLHYEEPLPKILLLNESSFVFFYPSSGILKIFESGSESEYKLSGFSSGEINFAQERLGHIKIFKSKIFIFLSQIEKDNSLISELFILDEESKSIKTFQLPLSHIHNVFDYNSRLLFSCYQTEPFFETGFYEILFSENNFSQVKLVKISDILVENQIKNFPRYFYSSKCVFELRQNSLHKISACLEKENIIDAIYFEQTFYFLTRSDLNINFYSISHDLQFLNKEIFENIPYLASLLLTKNNLYLYTDTQIIPLKNFTEE